MPYPSNVATVTVTATYTNTGTGAPASGTVSFMPNTTLQDGTASVILSETPLVATLNANGSISVTLMATDDGHLSPSGWSYNIVENVSGMYRNYFLQFPAAQSVVDLSTKAPVITPPATVQYVALSNYTAKGALVAGTGLSTIGTLTVGTDGQFLQADSTQTAGIKWATLSTTANVRYRGAWAASTAYLVNDVFTYAGSSWAVNTGFTSGTSFSTTNLDNLDSPPYVFNVMWYGAKGDGKFVSDGVITGGTTTLTSATAGFVAADAGKAIMIKGAGAAGQSNFVTTIASVTNSTTVVLSSPVTTTVASGGWVLWGTDDTAAFQSAINAAVTYANSHGYFGKVFIPESTGKFYAIAGALVTGGATLGNAQLTLPIIPVAQSKVTLVFEGVGNQTALFHWNQTMPQFSGSTLVSFGNFANAPTQTSNINANGNPAVIGGPTQPNGYGTSALLFSNMLPVFNNMSILTTFSQNGWNYTAIDMSGCAEGNIFDTAIGVTAAFSDLGSNANNLANGLSIGILLPATGNNDNTEVRNLSIMGGFTWGIHATEHSNIDNIRVTYCWSAINPIGAYFSSVGASHAVSIGQASVEGCTRHINTIGSGQGGIGPIINIQLLDTEGAPIIFDGSNGNAMGDINLTGYNPPTLTNRTGIRVRNIIQQPGVATGPTLTLNTPVMNNLWRDATVTLSGGTVTAVKQGGPTTGTGCLGGTAPTMTAVWTGGLTTPLSINVPPGGWVEVDGSVSPTAVWVLS